MYREEEQFKTLKEMEMVPKKNVTVESVEKFSGYLDSAVCGNVSFK